MTKLARIKLSSYTIKSLLVLLFIFALLLVYYQPFSSAKTELKSIHYTMLSHDDCAGNSIKLHENDTLITSVVVDSENDIHCIDIALASTDLFQISKTNSLPFTISISTKYVPDIELNNEDDLLLIDGNWLRIKLPAEICNDLHINSNPVQIKMIACSGSEQYELHSSVSMVNNTYYRINGEQFNRSLVVRGVIYSDHFLYVLFWFLLLVFGIVFCVTQNGATVRSYILFSITIGVLYLVTAIYPLPGEGSLLANALSHTYQPNAINQYNEVWMPSRLFSSVSYLYDSFHVFENEFTPYILTHGMGFTLIEWIYVPLLLIAKNMNMTNTATVILLRAFTYAICVVLNALAIGKAKNNKPVLFALSVIPLVLISFVSVSSYSILISLCSLFLSLVCAGVQPHSMEDFKPFGLSRLIFISIILFFISVQNILFGLLGLVFLFHIRSDCFRKDRKSSYLWLNALLYCAALAFGIFYVVTNKTVYSEITAGVSDHLRRFFDNPVSMVIASVKDLLSSIACIINRDPYGVMLSGTFGCCVVFGMLLLLFSQNRLRSGSYPEPGNPANPSGLSLTVIITLLTAFFVLFSALLGVVDHLSIAGLFAPILAFISSSVCARREYGAAMWNDRQVPFCLLVVTVISAAGMIG